MECFFLAGRKSRDGHVSFSAGRQSRDGNVSFPRHGGKKLGSFCNGDGYPQEWKFLMCKSMAKQVRMKQKNVVPIMMLQSIQCDGGQWTFIRQMARSRDSGGNTA